MKGHLVASQVKAFQFFVAGVEIDKQGRVFFKRHLVAIQVKAFQFFVTCVEIDKLGRVFVTCRY